jgi:hypothetical protein
MIDALAGLPQAGGKRSRLVAASELALGLIASRQKNNCKVEAHATRIRR